MQVLEVETFWKLSTITISELRWELWGYREASIVSATVSRHTQNLNLERKK